MASQSEEKDLIGSILSDQDEKADLAPKRARKVLSLKSKEFDPVEYMKQHEQCQNSNASILSTGYQTQQKQRVFFQTQTSIEIQSQLSSALQHTAEYTPSIDRLQCKISCCYQKKLLILQDSYSEKETQKNITQCSQLIIRINCINFKAIKVWMEKLLQVRLIQQKYGLLQDQICGNQLINRKLQNILDSKDYYAKNKIFIQVEKICLKASKDMFGNYTVQKIFEVGEFEQKLKIFNNLIESVLELSLNQYACRVVQKMLEFIRDLPEQLESFMQQLFPSIAQLLVDVNGNYVLLSCFETLSKNRLAFTIPLIEESLPFMSKQTYGCRVIQKVLEIYPLELTQRILDSLMLLAHQLCYQEFGNYIVQFILKSGPIKERQIICSIIKDNFESLSVNKFGSNTVEKYIDLYGPSQIMKTLCSISNDQFVFFHLSINPYGNYVMKKVLINGDPCVQYLKLVLKQYPDLIVRIKNSDFGQRVGQIMEAL